MSRTPLRKPARIRSGLAVLTLALGTSTAVVALLTPANAAPAAPGASARPGCGSDLLPTAQRAADVARKNPKAFAAAAQRNGSTAAAYQKLAEDRKLWLDRCGQGFYVEGTVTAAEAATATPTATALVPLTQTFQLESRPGANRTIYLDFDGATVTNSAWNSTYGANLVAEPYSNDATATTAFSDSELTEIQKAWQVVAEDYAPFDVNVTTKDPGSAAIDRDSSTDQVYGTRVLVTNGGTIYTHCGCGGIAYVNVFNTAGSNHGYYQPAWVFSNGTTKSGKYMAEAISHEAGHNFGLGHDGTSGGSSYYGGSSPWAPIMGSSYGQPVSQWSRGEYAGANNTQDDLAIIATGAPLRADDHGDDAAGATMLLSGAPADGVVTSRTDVDVFTFTGSGPTTLGVSGAAGLPDLDVRLTLRDAAGNTVATVDPTAARVSAYVASGLDATWSGDLAQGSYTVTVDGVGTGDPLTAGKYSDYGSIGNYRVSLTTQQTAVPLYTNASSAPGGTVGTAYAATPVTAGGGTAPYSWSASGLPAGLGIDAATGRISGTPSAAGSFAVTVTATDAAAATSSRSVGLSIAPAPTTVEPLAWVTGPSLPSAKLNRAYATGVIVSGGADGFTWALTSGALPAGLSLSWDGRTATISGTPAKTSKSTFTLRATDGSGATTSRTFTLSVRR